MNKLNGWMTGCLGLGMMLMACGGSDSTGPAASGTLTDAAITGKWDLTSVHTKGWETDGAGNHKNVDTTEAILSGTSTAEYKSDKTFSQGAGIFAVTGTWSIKGDSLLTVTTDFGPALTTSEYVVINGKTATFTSHQVDSETDLTVTNTATKQ